MDEETRAALADLTAVVKAGFARTDRYFELQQAQYLEQRGDSAEIRGDIAEIRGDIAEIRGDIFEIRGDIAEIRGDIAEIRGDIAEIRGELKQLSARIDRLEHEFRSFRDWATREFAEVRRELREVRRLVDDGQYGELRQDVDALSTRVARLESRLGD